MPPEGEKPRPTADEIEDLKQYILSLRVNRDEKAENAADEKPGSTDASRTTKVSRTEVIEALHDYLLPLDVEDRKFKRFFTLNHLHNLPTKAENPRRGVTNSYLDFVRAGTSKALNSLTWAPAIVTPELLGPENTVICLLYTSDAADE